MSAQAQTPDWTTPIPRRTTADPRFWDLLRRLPAAGYSDERVTALTGTRSGLGLSESRRAELRADLAERGDTAAVLTQLLCLDLPVAPLRLTRGLPPELGASVYDLLAWDLIEPDPRSPGLLRCKVAIRPLDGRLLLSDPEPTDGSRRYGPFGPAMAPGLDTARLARLTPARPGARVLDLCTGAGAQALLAASWAGTVLGVDRSPRALAYALLNARLESGGSLHFAQGDARQPPVQAGSVDLLLCNPPFVPTSGEGAVSYRDGGELGDAVLGAVVASLPQLLASGGEARLVADIALRAGESLAQRLQGWLREAWPEDLAAGAVLGPSYDLDEYAKVHSPRLVRGRMAWEPRWAAALRESYRAAGIDRVCRGVLAFRRGSSARTVAVAVTEDIDAVTQDQLEALIGDPASAPEG